MDTPQQQVLGEFAGQEQHLQPLAGRREGMNVVEGIVGLGTVELGKVVKFVRSLVAVALLVTQGRCNLQNVAQLSVIVDSQNLKSHAQVYFK